MEKLSYKRLIVSLAAIAAALGAQGDAIGATPAEATAELARAKVVPIEQVFATRAMAINRSNEKVSVQPGDIPLITLGDVNLLAVPVMNDGSKSRRLKVESHVIAARDNEYVMFYPIVSFVDSNFRVYQTIKPVREFAFDGSILTNEFEIPPGVDKLLIHTHEEYFLGPFVGRTYSGNRRTRSASGVAGVLGGIVGVLILYAATENDNKDFTFSEVGEIVINAD